MVVNPSEERSIVVMIPQSDPFFNHQNPSHKDLDVKIIETFAERSKFSVEYVVVNETLNEIFANEKTVENFSLNHVDFIES